ncbi:MAG: hypothetical protein WC451_05005 [Patescibacteria group bacterium]
MKTLYINNQVLIEGKKESFLLADYAIGVTSFNVESIVGFAVNLILQIGETGQENTEIVKTHAANAPSGLTVTLASATKFEHLQGTKVYIISYDLVEFSWSSTIDGVKTVLDTIDVQVDQIETQYIDTIETNGYYFIRFKEDIGNTFSGYSDPIPYEGYAINTVGSAITHAMKRNKMNAYTEFVDHDFMIEEINNCLMFAHDKLKKWHNLQEFDYELGQATRGNYRFAMPADAWQYSYKSVLGFRIGNGTNLTYKDKEEWEEELSGVNHALLSGSILTGATSLILDDSNDFPESGSIMIKGIIIAYTANEQSSGTLSGIPTSGIGSVTENLTSGLDVWNGDYAEGIPEFFTVMDGYIHYWPTVTANQVGRNGYLDYWKETPVIDSDNDILNFGRYDMVKYWLTAAVRSMIKNDGIRDLEDGDFKLFLQALNDAISIELKIQGQKYKRGPRLNKIQR